MKLAQIRHLTPNYTHLNQSSRIDAACKEHTAFKSADFAPGTNLFVVEVGEIVFDYNGMSHQPRPVSYTHLTLPTILLV